MEQWLNFGQICRNLQTLRKGMVCLALGWALAWPFLTNAQNTDSLRTLLEQALPDNQRLTVLYELCKNASDKGDTPQAYRYCTEAMKLAAKKADTALLIKTNNRLASAYLKGMVDTARLSEFSNRALQLSFQIKDSLLIAQSSITVGAYWLQRLWDRIEHKAPPGTLPEQAIQHFKRAAELYGAKQHPLKAANAWAKIGDVYNLLQQPLKALEYYQILYKASQQSGDDNVIMTANIQMAGVFIELGGLENFRKAIPYLEKGDQLAKRLGMAYEEMYCKSFLADTYAALQQFEKAYGYQKALASLKDSTLTGEKVAQLAEMEARYKTEKQTAEIAQQKLELEQQTNQKNRILIGAALLLLSLFAFFQQQRNRQKLREKNAELQAQAQAAEAEKLRALDSFKSRFFTNISHEFRTPLTVILGNADLIEKSLPTAQTPDPSAILSKIAAIRRNGEGLLRGINQILDLAKLGDNALKINYIQGNIVAFTRYVAESLHSYANAKNILIRVEATQGEILMDYDPERLSQILQNLISNALKFTTSGGQVTLGIEQVANPGNKMAAAVDTPTASSLLLTVQDTGAGIPPADLPHIFDRFFQAGNQEHSSDIGSGIGLALTQELVKLLDGNIWAESTLGVGTTFFVQLPMTNEALFAQPGASWHPERRLVDNPASLPPDSHRPPSALAVPLEQATDNNGQPQILLIEDNPDVVEYLRGCLSGQYRLEFAFNGRAGIEKALELVPDLIISDVMMPEKDGFEVCDALKNDLRTSHVPIILLTARATVEDRIAGLRRGADAYLAKPFHPEELIVQAAMLAESRRALRHYFTRISMGQAPESTPPETAAVEVEDAFLQQVRTVVQENLGNAALSAEDICRKIGMSHTNLNLKMNALTGMSTMYFVRTLRLQRAKTLLEAGQLNVSEVAWEVGFNDPKYFSRVFSEEFGKPPSEWRAPAAQG